jgi:two-component SAPR family response regulator
MKWLFVFLFLLGFAYMWFSQYQPKPSPTSMQGVVQEFQSAIEARDINRMRAMCTPVAAEGCQRILDDITETEELYRQRGLDVQLESVGSFGFGYTRGAREIDGFVSGTSSRGREMFSLQVRVSQQEGETWRISHIQ